MRMRVVVGIEGDGGRLPGATASFWGASGWCMHAGLCGSSWPSLFHLWGLPQPVASRSYALFRGFLGGTLA